MAALDATVGGPDANSYPTVSEATALLAARLHTESWLEADQTSQAQALMWATQLIEEQMRWHGVPTTMTQALAWPQTGQVDHLGRPVPPTIVPTALKRATAYYALPLLASVATVDTSGIKSRRVGDTEITYHDPPEDVQVESVSEAMPAEVQAILRPYGLLQAPMAADVAEIPLKRATFDVD